MPEIGLKNLNDEDSSKEEIKEAIFFRNYLDMKEDMENTKSWRLSKIKILERHSHTWSSDL